MANRYGASYRNGNGYGNFGPPQQAPQQQGGDDDYDPYGDNYVNGSSGRNRSRPPPARSARRPQMQPPPPQQQPQQTTYGGGPEDDDRYDVDQMTYQPPPPRRRPDAMQIQSQSQQRQIGQDALDRIRGEWPAMCETDCIPVQMALQLLDSSSVGRAHEYRAFQQTHLYLQDSLKSIVHDYHQGFNSSIGTFHKIQSSIQASQKRVRGLKETLALSKTSLCRTDPELKKLYASSQMYDELLQTLGDLDELRQVPERLEARISEKQFLTAVDVLQNALRKLRKPELDGIGALADLRSYLANQETALMDILVEELHEHLYLKSPYCQERWQALSKAGSGSISGSNSSNGEADSSAPPFFALLDSMEFQNAVQEDPARNPEGDTFYYITLVIESLNKLGRLEAAVDQLKQRLPVELFGVVNETVNEVDQKHPSSLRGASSSAASAGTTAASSSSALVSSSGGPGGSGAAGGANASYGNGLHLYGRRETQLRADVLYDLLWTLYGKFEAIAEGHRVFHEYVKALIRREGAGNNSILLGSFKELWNLYQNEIRSLLHNYVTTDADLYRSMGGIGGSSGGFYYNNGGSGYKGIGREPIFKFAEADAKSPAMTTEYDALDGIIRSAVPGLTSNNGASSSSGGRKNASAAEKKISMIGSPNGSRTNTSERKSLTYGGSGSGNGGGSGYESGQQPGDIHKPLVEPSVFNMSLMLPPTLIFLQRLKGIVPPGSDLAASTLTSFLDNFLVNVFQPQLEETLGKLSDAVFGEADAFQTDPRWSQLARRPVFKGTTAFFAVVTAFCRMLGTIPHDQALSGLIITQMMRYYDRCFSWYKSLVTKTQETAITSATSPKVAQGSSDDNLRNLRWSAVLALEEGDVAATAKQLWATDELESQDQQKRLTATSAAAAEEDVAFTQKQKLLKKEVNLLIARASEGGRHLDMSDIISDRDTVTSLCLLYTSMKWLAVKVQSLRHITQQGTESASRSGTSSLSKPDKRRWTLLNDPNKAVADDGPVYLPMTQETVQSFDSIVSSYEELATTSLLTLHLEVRSRIAYSLGVALSPKTAPYLLDQDVNEPDPQILSLNSELIAYDETTVRYLRPREVDFVRNGLGRLINAYLVGNANMVTPMNTKGCGRMQLNILVLQQNLKNVEEGVDLARAANYYALFDQGPDAIVAKAKECKEKRGGPGGGSGPAAAAAAAAAAATTTPTSPVEATPTGGEGEEADGEEGGAGRSNDNNENNSTGGAQNGETTKNTKDAIASGRSSSDLGGVEDEPDMFSYDELKELIELYYSEQLANPERGIENAARRQMGEKLMELGEHLWQM